MTVCSNQCIYTYSVDTRIENVERGVHTHVVWHLDDERIKGSADRYVNGIRISKGRERGMRRINDRPADSRLPESIRPGIKMRRDQEGTKNEVMYGS